MRKHSEMPIRRDTPRPSFRRTDLKVLEKYKLALASHGLNDSVRILLLLALWLKKHERTREQILAMRCASVLAEMLDVNATLANLPRQQPITCGRYKEPDEFDDSTFLSQFRFRKEHFWMFLQALRWTDAAGRPKTIKFGKRLHQYNMPSHYILMILLRRLAFPARWVDINLILGGAASTSSSAYNFALCYFFQHYVPLITDLHRWKHKFAEFAKRLSDMGAPFDNLVAFVDGHFDPMARPGGDGNVRYGPKDYHMFNHLHKDHGIMFQGAVMVNGLALGWGPYGGNENDARTVDKAGITEMMRAISMELGVDYSNFADSAYTQNRYMQCIQKCLPGAALSRPARRFNSLMARFRIVIENLFGETENIFASLQHKQNKRLGRQDISKMFLVSLFLFNVRSIFYGNQTGCYYGLDGLAAITLEEFLHADAF